MTGGCPAAEGGKVACSRGRWRQKSQPDVLRRRSPNMNHVQPESPLCTSPGW